MTDSKQTADKRGQLPGHAGRVDGASANVPQVRELAQLSEDELRAVSGGPEGEVTSGV